MSMMKTKLTTIPMCPRERFAVYKSFQAYPLLQKGLGHLAALYLLLLLVARYNLSRHKTICYHLFQYLQRIPC